MTCDLRRATCGVARATFSFHVQNAFYQHLVYVQHSQCINTQHACATFTLHVIRRSVDRIKAADTIEREQV